jgi:hypothetical protein
MPVHDLFLQNIDPGVQIAQLIDDHCQGRHGGLGKVPFSLLSTLAASLAIFSTPWPHVSLND